jgi:hypothetical protein
MIERSVIGAAVLVLALMVLYPPFMAIDRGSDGRVHAALGRYPIWNATTAEYAFRRLYPDETEIPSPQRLVDFVPRRNRVRLVEGALEVVIAATIVVWVLRRYRRPRTARG